MGNLGDKLRDARQSQQLSLDDVEAATKIRKKYIIALEQEDFSRLPAPIYTKGFVRNYASFLGLDADALVEMFQDPESHRLEPVTYLQKPPKAVGSGLVVLIIIIMVGMVGVYLYEQGSTMPIEQPELIVELPTATPAPSPTASQIPTQAPGPRVYTNTVEVQVKTFERAWLAVAVDSQPVFTDTLAIGDNLKWAGKEKVVMWIGNAGGLEFTVNGQRKGFLGKPGEVLTVEFTPDGHKVLPPARPTQQSSPGGTTPAQASTSSTNYR